MIEVKLSFPDQAALIAFFVGATTGNSMSLMQAALAATKTQDASAAVTPEKQVAARASTAAGKAEKAVAEKAVAEKAVAEIAKPAADKPKTPTVDYPTLQKAVFELVAAVKAKGLDPAVHVLGVAKQFGYDSFAKMKEAGPEGAMQYEPALAAVKAKAAEIAEIVVEEAVA